MLVYALLLIGAGGAAQPRPRRPAPEVQQRAVRPPAEEPESPAERPEAPSPRDPLQRALEGRREVFLTCYTVARRQHPNLQGTVTLRIQVGPGGRVLEGRASGIDGAESFLRCLERRLTGLRLEGVMSGAEYSVPMEFRPEG